MDPCYTAVMAFRLAVPTLDLWQKAKSFFQEFKAGRFADRINVELMEFEQFYRLQGLSREIGVLLMEDDDNEIVGMAVLQEVAELVGIVHKPRTLIRGVHIRTGIGFGAGRMMYEFIHEWGRLRGHDEMVAYVRQEKDGHNNFKMRAAAKRFGLTPRYIVMAGPILPVEARHGKG